MYYDDTHHNIYVCDGVEYVMDEGFGRVHFFYFYLFITPAGRSPSAAEHLTSLSC